MNIITLGTFLLMLLAAAGWAWSSVGKHAPGTLAGLFFGNRKLGGMAVGFGLLFANINTTSFVGENELTFTNNMSVMAWGVTGVVVMLFVSEFIIPIYLRTGISTTPDFLEARYDRSTKTLVSVIFLLNYIVNLLPAVLYGGAVALEGLFGLSAATGLSYWHTIWLLVACMGVLGTAYSLTGGLKGITISGTMLGFAMFTVGLLLPYFALRYLGAGNWEAGLHTVLGTDTARLNSIGQPGDAIPFGTIFTGMLLVNLYYWSTEQYIVQQALGSKDLSSCQKGIALAGFGKLVLPLLLNIPGVIAAHIYHGLPNSASVFSRLIRDVSPPVYTGFMAALLFGASVTTFIAALNSSGTLFILNIYKPLVEKRQRNIDDAGYLRAAKVFGIALCIVSILVAPFIHFATGGLYTYLQKIGALFSVPIFTIMAVGFMTKKVPAVAAKAGLLFFIVCYGASQFIFDFQLHFLHILAVLFVVTTGLMLLIGRWKPRPVPFELPVSNLVEVRPWKNRHIAAVCLIAMAIGLYLLFSGFGVAGKRCLP